ncbi:MAG: diacylglycerol kinase [Parahaliea sp.]
MTSPESAPPHMNKPGKRGLARLTAAAGNSWNGMRAAWRTEEAFRMEVSLALIFIPLAFVFGEGLPHQLVLVLCCTLVGVAEIVNTAIESIVDRISLEHDPLSGQAKDLGSAAVLISLLLCSGAWVLTLWQWLRR